MNNLTLDRPQCSEALPLASEMSRALSRYIDAEMAQRARQAGEAIAQVETHAQEIANRPCGDPRSATFFELAALAKVSPERAETRWLEIREAARAEWQTGHRAAAAIDEPLSMSAWTRASFLALRDELAEGWNPRNGTERTLIDTLALSWAAQLFWQERMMLYACVESDNEQIKKEGRWGTPRVADAQAVEQAAQMVDRFNRIFTRTLRALKDLRRMSPPVVVQSVGQLNVAEQQINVA
jgi:hypothetical protein